MHTVEVQFRDDEAGVTLTGELVNSYRLVESASARSGFGVEVDQIRDGEIDVMVFDLRGNMQAHRINMSQVTFADEVAI